MNETRATKVLAAHADELIGHPQAMQQISVTDKEYRQLAPLFQLAEQLHQSMPPVRPPAAFVCSLGQEIVEQTERQFALKKRWRRVMVIGAATLGSLVSIVSVVGAILLVVTRLRARAQARALQAQTA